MRGPPHREREPRMLYGLLIILIGVAVAYLGHSYTPPPVNVILLIVGVVIALYGAYYLITSIATPTADDYESLRAVIGW